MEFTLLWAAAGAALALYGGLWLMGRRDTSLCVSDLWEIALGAALTGLVVGRITAMIRQGVSPISNPGDLILVRAGVDTVGASVAALLAAMWLSRSNLSEQLDGLAPAAVLGLAGWHAGCVFRAACLGTPSDLPWAWAQTEGGVSRHPVELYTALLLVVAGPALFRARLRYPPALVVSGLALAAVGTARLITEPLRPALFSGPVWWYGAAIAIGLSGALLGWRRSATGPGSLQ